MRPEPRRAADPLPPAARFTGPGEGGVFRLVEAGRLREAEAPEGTVADLPERPKTD
jgi:hypothetical protein